MLTNHSESTEKMEDTAWSSDPFEIDQVIRSFQNKSNFIEKLLIQLEKKGYSGPSDNERAIIAFLKECYAEANIDYVDRTLKNWLASGKPSTNKDGRKNILRLCFALGLTVEETANFFHFALFEPAFNFKDLFEASCYFCMNNGRPYSDVEELIKTIDALPKGEGPESTLATVRVGEEIKSITDENAFINYWISNCISFARQKVTATEEAKHLLSECYGIATEYCERMRLSDKDTGNWPRRVNSPDKLLLVIYGFFGRATQSVKDASKAAGKKRVQFYTKRIAKSDFPDSVKRNFPQRRQIQFIEEGTATYDILRKAIIVLHFFSFFASLENKGFPTDGCYEDYTDSINSLLIVTELISPEMSKIITNTIGDNGQSYFGLSFYRRGQYAIQGIIQSTITSHNNNCPITVIS